MTYNTDSERVAALRVLRYAKAQTPLTLTPPRRAVLDGLVSRRLVERVGERRSGALVRLTKTGEDELRVLEQLVGGRMDDFAASQAARRARG